MEKNDNISRETLIRYLKGELSDEEAWKVEKAMQEDPFLAEAMEGLEMAMHDGGVSDDLEELQRRINIREKTTEGTFFAAYIRIAAVILVLVVSIIGVYELFFRNPVNRSELAMQKDEVKKDTGKTATFNDAGTAQSDRQRSNPIQESESEQAKPGIPQRETNDLAAGEKDTGDKEERAGNALTRTTSPGITDTSTSIEINPRVTSATEVPSAVSSDMAAGAMKKETRSRREGVAKSQPFEATNQVLSSELNNSHPLPGDSAYRVFIQRNLSYPVSARQHGVEGDVTVAFTVKPDSTLSNFTIVEGIGSGCNEEAVRLIRQGPKWVPRLVNGKPVSSNVVYSVHFRLKK